MNIKNNKKAKQSKLKIKNTIQNLINNKTVNNLTIKKICTEASINRTTFYAHFENIEDCLYDMCSDKTIIIMNVFFNNSISYSDKIKQSLFVIKDNYNFFEYCFKHLHNLESFVIELLESQWPQMRFFPEYEKAKLSLSYMISGFIGIGKIYFKDLNLNKTSKISINEFAELICNLINFNNKYFPIK